MFKQQEYLKNKHIKNTKISVCRDSFDQELYIDIGNLPDYLWLDNIDEGIKFLENLIRKGQKSLHILKKEKDKY